MRPVLFTIFGLDIQSYGVSKAAAAVIAAWLLGLAFERRGLNKDSAHTMVLWAAVWGFVGAKIYYLLEQYPMISLHDLGGMGFTWYGGLLGGTVAAFVVVRRHHLPLPIVAGAAALPLTVAYGIGRIGCLISGDGTYGSPTDLPWAMAFPTGVVATDVPVHPAPLYEAAAAVLIAAALLYVGRRWRPWAVFGAYLALSGLSRLLVEFVRINDPVLLGLTQPQLWALASLALGLSLILQTRRPGMRTVQPPRATPLPAASSSSR